MFFLRPPLETFSYKSNCSRSSASVPLRAACECLVVQCSISVFISVWTVWKAYCPQRRAWRFANVGMETLKISLAFTVFPVIVPKNEVEIILWRISGGFFLFKGSCFLPLSPHACSGHLNQTSWTVLLGYLVRLIQMTLHYMNLKLE